MSTISAVAKAPSPHDRLAVMQIALSGLAAGQGLGEIARRLEPMHPKGNTFPGEVLLDLAADAIEEPGASREQPIEFEKIRERYLPECTAHTKAQHHKSEYAIRAAAMLRAGVDPGLLDEVIWWRTDDLWLWAFDALVVYLRAAADRLGVPVIVICERLAFRRGVDLSVSG
jgi:hypothetical protein